MPEKLTYENLLEKIKTFEQEKTTMHDITDTKNARDSLEIKDDQYRLLFENMTNGFALHEIVTNDASEPIDYIFLDVNAAFEKLTGTKKEHIIGKKVTQIFPGIEKKSGDLIGRYGKVAQTGEEIQFEQDFQNPNKWYSVVAFSPRRGQFATIFEDITYRKETETSLNALKWLLKKSPAVPSDFSQEYTDPTEFNTCRVILDNIGKYMLSEIVTGYLELLETSSAVYEINGDYAHGIFSSGWCRMMDSASRKLCNTPNDKIALNTGKWLCHESCWTDASKTAIDTVQPVDIECNGGLRLYAVPITAHDQVIGVINFGYGDPPRDTATLETISKKYHLDINDLIHEADKYEHRPNFIIELAKRRLHSSAKLIGVMVELKLAQARVEQEQEQLKVTLKSIGDAVITTDINSKIILINDVAQTLTGWSQGDACGKNVTEVFQIINGQTQEACENPVKKVLETNQVAKLANNTVLIARDGTRRVIDDSVAPIIDTAKRTIGVVLVFRDMTEKLELETALRHVHKMEAIGNLAGGIAHEFNNILSIMIGNNELVMDELPKWSLARENTEEIRIAGLRARDVVKQLLTFSRQDDAAKKVINIRSLVHESMKLIRSTIPANIEIRQALSDDGSLLLGNGTQINQVMINLCNNAVDALPDIGGVLTVTLSTENLDEKHVKQYPSLKCGQYIKLDVSDNGIGMDKKILDRVFDPYFTTKGIGKGTGIGLAVVHGIVERHDGVIIVDSHLGQGTTFTILLPAYEGLLKQEIDTQNNLPTGEECILYVDDETSIANLGKLQLESLGYRTESTSDPLKALGMVRTDPNKFDLVITDMAMPKMTGDRLIAEILKIRQDMPTIICTGYSDKFSENEAKAMGVSSFVMKPLARSDLATAVRNVLDKAKNKI
jgi:PAS domain S-box-containing protein